MRNFKLIPILLIAFLFISEASFGQSSYYNNKKAHHCKKKPASVFTMPTKINPVEERARREDEIPNFYGIALYKPTYFLPYYYTGSPDNVVYHNLTPNNELINHAEVKYQFSLKVPLWKNMFNHSSLMLAYTQLSYWQLYNNKKFFRSNDYEPEIFLENHLNRCLTKNWHIDFLNVGLSHQSNGEGNSLERSWNRLYVEAITSAGNWMISIKPWVVISENKNNPNIAKFLGYGRFLVAYKCHQHVFSIQAHNLIEGGARYATGEATWSFPLTPYLKGYVQVFSGYGQSLIEYNHRTNSAGIGLALNDWI